MGKQIGAATAWLEAGRNLELLRTMQFFGHNFHHKAQIELNLDLLETRLLD